MQEAADLANPAASVTREDLTNGFLLDSGCSNHSTWNRDLFIDFKSLKLSPIKGIGGVQVTPTGKGSIRIPTNGTSIHLSEVYFVPNMGLNLISTGQLEEKGFTLGFGKKANEGISFQKRCTKTGQMHVYTSTKKNRLSFLDLDPRKSRLPKILAQDKTINTAMATASFTYSTNPANALWHLRMGHLGDQNVNKLTDRAYGVDLHKSVQTEVTCEACIYGGMKTRPHNHPIKPGRKHLELIHFDLVGPVPTTGPNGERYLAHILDDHTKSGDIECLKTKKQAFEYFLSYKKRVERAGFKIRRIRLDVGELATLGLFQTFCREEGIITETIVSYNPSQNGSAERHGQSIWEKTSKILKASGLPLEQWPEVSKTAVYLLDRCPHSALPGQITPYEALTGDKPDLSHIRTLGSTVYNLVGKHKKKGDDRAVTGKLIGFDSETIYRILLPNNKVIRGYSVHIKERIPPEFSSPTASSGLHKRKAILPPDSGENTVKSVERCAKKVKITSDEDELDTQSFEDGLEIPSQSVYQPGSMPQQTPPRTLSREYQPLSDPLTPPAPGTPGSPDPLAWGMFAFLAEANQPEPFEPKTYKGARQSSSWSLWKLAAKEEYGSLMENGTWKLVKPPPDRKILTAKWVFKLKRGSNQEVTRYKARWVVRGFEQEEGLDYHETFASVVKPMSYKSLFAIAAALDWEIEQMDVKTAFLYGGIDEEIYVHQPEGEDDGTGRVCKLLKALYGLKQAPRIWYETLARFLEELGYTALDSDMSVFQGHGIIVAIYVDDLLIFGPDISKIRELKKALSAKFKMVDLGACSYYLGMKVERDRENRTLKLSQTGYLEKILEQFGMSECAPKDTPMQTSNKRMAPSDPDHTATSAFKKQYQSAVGSLMYAMLGTRPDIAYAVSVVSRYASNPNDHHWNAVKYVFRYLRGTLQLSLTFRGGLGNLTGYTDSDWAGDLGTRRSTSGYVFNIGSGAISWSSKRQPTISLSSCEAEYIGQTQAIKRGHLAQEVLSRRLFRRI